MSTPFNLTYDAAVAATTGLVEVMVKDLIKQREAWGEQFPKAKELYPALNEAFDKDPNTEITATAETLKYYGATRSLNGGIMELEALSAALSLASSIARAANAGDNEILGQMGLDDLVVAPRDKVDSIPFTS